MVNRFNLTPRAKEDLRGIWNYTVEVWNLAQADRYITQIYECFSWLAAHPNMGKHRADIREGYHCFPQNAHLIFYLIRDGSIDIIGVLHKEMDVLKYFESDD